MSIFNFFLIVSVTLSGLSCAEAVSTQNHNVLLSRPQLTPTPPKESVGNKGNLNLKAKDYFDEGLRHKTAGEYEKAVEEFKKSIEAGNNDKEMYRRIAELYISLKRFEDAEIYLQKVLEKDSKDARAHWELAGLRVWHLKKYEEGLKAAMLAKELDASDTSYVIEQTIGRAYEGLGEHENAVKHYKIFLKGISFAPHSNDYKETKNRIEMLEKSLKKQKE